MQQTGKKFIIYAYRLTNDTGSAPCIYDLNGNPTGVLTLVCCKGGQIRHKNTQNEREIKTGLRHIIGKKHKEKIGNGQDEVYLMGIYKNKLLYFAKIAKILNMEDYFDPNSPYKGRHDDIYEIFSGGFKRNVNNPKFHPKGQIEVHRKDWLGGYALISNCFAYWGKESKVMPQNLLKMLPLFQGHKCYELNTPEGMQIMCFVEKLWDFKNIIQKSPHDYINNINSKGCGKNENHPVPQGI